MTKRKLIISLILSILINNICFSQKKEPLSLYQNALNLFEKGRYSTLLHIYKNKKYYSDSTHLNNLFEQTKRSIYLTKKVKYHIKKHQIELAKTYIDSLKNVNIKDPKIATYYLELGDLMLIKGNIISARYFLNQSKNFSQNSRLKSQNAHLELLQKRVKYLFVKKQVDYFWLDDYATLTKKKFVKRNESKKIDSLYNTQKDSLNYVKWRPMLYTFGGFNNDKFILNSTNGQKYLTLSDASILFGLRLFLSPPMKKISYFTDISFSNHNFQNIEVIGDVKYYIEKFSFSSISLPINIKYNLTHSAKHFYTTAGISPIYVFNEKYEHSFNGIKLNNIGIFKKILFAFNSTLGYQIESKKKKQSVFFETKLNLNPINLINSNASNDDLGGENKLNSKLFGCQFFIGVKF